MFLVKLKAEGVKTVHIPPHESIRGFPVDVSYELNVYGAEKPRKQ